MSTTTTAQAPTGPEKDGPKDSSLVEKTVRTLDVKNLNIIDPTPEEQTKTTTETTTVIKDGIIAKPDVSVTPEEKPSPQIAVKDKLSLPLLRFQLRKTIEPRNSTYVPTALNYFEVVHYMDKMISQNTYFDNMVALWHPFLSRAYYGALFYYQTLRAAKHAKALPLNIMRAVNDLERILPPEQLPVPGPLVPILKSITSCRPASGFYGFVSPTIPLDGIPRAYDALIPENDAMLLQPNIPALIGLMNKIINAQPDQIPDFTNRATISEGQPFDLNGHDFPLAWQATERLLLLQPGLTHPPETDRKIDRRFNRFGGRLNLPAIDADEPLRFLDYLGLSNINWISDYIPTAASYSLFFKESSTLGSCSPSGPATPLIRSRLTGLTSRVAADNVVNTLTESFPAIFPFQLVYDHRSYETDIPQIYKQIGQYSATNTSTTYRGLGRWSEVNTLDHGRTGPYWDQNPSFLYTGDDNCFNSVETCITSQYFISSPKTD